MPDHDRAIDCKMAMYAGHVLGQNLRSVWIHRLRRSAVTAQIDDDDSVIDGEIGGQPTPIRAVARPPMQQEHCRSAAVFRIEDLNVVRNRHHRHFKRAPH